MKRLQVQIPDELMDRVKRKSIEDNLTMTALVQLAFKQLLDGNNSESEQLLHANNEDQFYIIDVRNYPPKTTIFVREDGHYNVTIDDSPELPEVTPEMFYGKIEKEPEPEIDPDDPLEQMIRRAEASGEW